MKKYRVNVNGTVYEVDVEEITAPAVAVKENNITPSVPVRGETITAPMPGNILDVRCKVGDAVKKGDVLMILEAMKMENEIMCPRDGRLSAVNVIKGAAVETGSVLCAIE